MSSIRLIVRAKCGLMVKFREDMGGITAKVAAEMTGIRHSTWSAYECLRKDPRGAWHPSVLTPARNSNNGSIWKPTALKIAHMLGENPEDIWTDDVLAIKQPVINRDVDALALASAAESPLALPSAVVADAEMRRDVSAALDTLTDRERRIVRMRLWDDMTFEEVGEVFGIMPTRIRQIEAKAMRKLRHKSRAEGLKAHAGVDW